MNDSTQIIVALISVAGVIIAALISAYGLSRNSRSGSSVDRTIVHPEVEKGTVENGGDPRDSKPRSRFSTRTLVALLLFSLVSVGATIITANEIDPARHSAAEFIVIGSLAFLSFLAAVCLVYLLRRTD